TVLSAFNKDADFEVISTASTREAAIKQLSMTPDVLILNPEILKGHTLSRFIRTIQTKSPHTRMMYFLSKATSDEHLITDIKGGIRGYIKSTDSPAAIIKAVHAVHSGEIWAERRILEK